MPALQDVEVYNCGLSSLFTCSVFRNLQKLQRLKISACTFLEEIVEDVKFDEHVGTNTMTITLLHLDTLAFYDLPKLKSFTHGQTMSAIFQL